MKTLLTTVLFLAYFIASAQQDRVHSYDIYKGLRSSTPQMFTIFKGNLYVVANDSIHGGELWRIDKLGNAKMVSDLYPGSTSGGYPLIGGTNIIYSSQHMAVTVNDTGGHVMMYMMGNNGLTGWEIYKYDSNYASPVISYEYKAGSAGMGRGGLNMTHSSVIKNKVYSSCSFDAPSGKTKVYEYDPSNNAFRFIDSTVAAIYNSVGYKNKLYYTANDTCFEYDPSTNIRKKILVPQLRHIHVAGDKLYLGGKNLYEYDGVTAPKDISDFCEDFTDPFTWPIGEHNGKIYFPCKGNTGQCQPCEYNPTTKITKQLGGKGRYPHSFVSCKGQVYFAAKDSAHGYEIWTYDGVKAPYLEVDVDPSIYASNPFYITSFEGSLYFAGIYYLTGYELLRYTPGTFPSSVSNLFFDGEVKIYPNPVNEVCNIQISLKEPKDIAIQLYDITGKAILTRSLVLYPTGTSTVNVDMKELMKGMYYIRLSGNGGTLLYSNKILKD